MRTENLNSGGAPEGVWKLLTFRAIAVIAICCLPLSVVQAQPQQSREKFVRTQAAQGTAPNGQYQPPRVGHRGDWLRKYGNLPSDQAKKQLQEDKDFQKLPPERQQSLQQRLDHFNSLPPQQKQRVLNRMALIERLPADQQKQLDSLWQQFRGMDEGRRRAMIQQLHQLRSQPPEQRGKTLESEQFKTAFNPQEQQLIRGLSNIDVQLQAAGKNITPK